MENKIKRRVLLGFLLITSFIGIMTIGTFAHELVHWQDFKPYSNKMDLCVYSLNYQEGAGYVHAYGDTPDSVGNLTEPKAYIGTLLILLPMIWALSKVVEL